MAIDLAKAVAAYARSATAGSNPGLAAPARDTGEAFANLVRDAVGGAIDTGHVAERVSAKAIAGQTDLNQVVTAVNNAEVTLQTVLAVRDKVIQAYQDIIRMPI
jgi:flagellar hook-basal body complex protein FliE